MPIDAFRELLHYQVVKELLSELVTSSDSLIFSVSFGLQDVEEWSLRVMRSMYSDGTTNHLYARGVENPWTPDTAKTKISSNIWE